MSSFSSISAWSFISIITVLLVAMLIGNMLKKSIKVLNNSLIPTSVIGGLLILIVSIVYEAIFKIPLFNTTFFGGTNTEYDPSKLSILEVLTYHCLALGTIAVALKNSNRKLDKKRSGEIFDSGITTVATYLMQGFLGLLITVVIALIIPSVFAAAGIILPFGYGQGTGQALNYGGIFEQDYGFIGGRSFGLTIAALGFLSASIGGVIHLLIIQKKGIRSKADLEGSNSLLLKEIQGKDEVSLYGSIEKLTIQVCFILITYVITFLIMKGISALAPGMETTIFGFNFLFGVLVATLLKVVLKFFKKKRMMKKEYVNNFMMDRLSGLFFDLMVTAGIAAIRIDILQDYWWIIIVLGLVGAFTTFYYNKFIARKLFPSYSEEQFLVMYGMLTGTASTGIILLREIDPEYKTEAMNNMVFQQLPAILFGFPMMILATLAPKNPYLVLGIVFAYFVVLNVILFRKFIFKKKNKPENIKATE